MARPTKTGLDYFPMDTDFFEDDKVQLIEAEFGIKGVYVFLRLLCKIYRNGWFYKWGDTECLLLSRQLGAGFVPQMVDEIVKGLVRRSLFDKGVFDSFQVLTSAAIQKRFYEAVKRTRTRVSFNPDYCLIDSLPQENTSFPQENPDKPQINALKEKKRKVFKEKENKEKEIPPGLEGVGGGVKFSDLLREMAQDTEWVQATAMYLSVTQERLTQMLVNFKTYCIASAQAHGNKEDARRHFVNWAARQPKQQGYATDNRTGNGGIDISTNRPEDYRRPI